MEPELRDEINRLCTTLDFSVLGDRAVNIAADLVASYPDLAIRIVEKATNTPGDENALDLAFAKLSISALGSEGDSAREKTSDDIYARIKDPALRRLSTEAFFLVGQYTPNEILAQAERIERTADALYLVSRWCVKHGDTAGAEQVVHYALKRALKTSEYVPNALILRRLASPVPKIALRRPFEANQLFILLDSQVSNVARIGPNIDVIRLRLLLSETPSTWEDKAAIDRLEDIYLAISAINDLPERSEGLGWLWHTLTTNTTMPEEKTAHLETAVKADIVQAMELLLDVSAEQQSAFQGVFRALAATQFSFCMSYLKRLNIQARRDHVGWELLNQILRSQTTKPNARDVSQLIDMIDNEQVKTAGLMSVLERLAETGGEQLEIDEGWASLLAKAEKIDDRAIRCRACSLAFAALSRGGFGKGLLPALRAQTKAAWDAITDTWIRIELGFELCSTFAATERDEAQRYLTESETIRKETPLASAAAGAAYVALLRLALRACAGLARKNLADRDLIRRLLDLIGEVPSAQTRVSLAAELAIRIFASGDANLSRRIVAENVRPELAPNKVDSSNHELLIEVAPALYIFHKQTALERIQALPPSLRDRAYERVCDYLITKLPHDEPRDTGPWHAWSMTYEEMIDVLELASCMRSDHSIYWNVKAVADSAEAAVEQATMTREQKLDVAGRIEKLATTVLHLAHLEFPTTVIALSPWRRRIA